MIKHRNRTEMVVCTELSLFVHPYFMYLQAFDVIGLEYTKWSLRIILFYYKQLILSKKSFDPYEAQSRFLEVFTNKNSVFLIIF
jgi:hypothetical protein